MKSLSLFRISLFFALFAYYSPQLKAQNALDQSLSVKSMESVSIQEVLKTVERDQGFYFSYNSNIIPVDSLVSVARFKGSVRHFMLGLLGNDYEFVETPGYIIIRYAPNRLFLDENEEIKEGKSWLITGKIKDLRSDNLIAYASVYDRSTLQSSLTDKRGYFELKVKNPNESILLTISKENYRDTTFMLLPPVDIQADRKSTPFRYSTESNNDEALQSTFFGQMMIGFKQRMQSLNIGDFITEMPAQVSLLPRVGTHGLMNGQVVNHASLNIIGGYTAGTSGMEIGGIFNINRQNTKYFQVAGIFNLVGGNVEGIQIAGISNRVLGAVDGFQAAGAFNITGDFHGMQVAGLYNKSKQAKGLQVAGLFNQAEGLSNVQVAGILNKAEISTDMQLGLINIADSSAYPIGLVNIIRSGEKSLSFAYDELDYLSMTLRTGGTFSYGLLGIAYALEDRTYNYALDVGLGLHLSNSRLFSLDTELMSRTSLGPVTSTLNTGSLKIIPGLKPKPHFKLFVGPSLNFISRQDLSETHIPGWVIEDFSDDRSIKAWYIGWSTGLSYIF
ncbi:hypothetical protein GCM10007049_05710 [Echinicola pacifica]|uniref:CarboxypepD_reg-like domain-containing protein n=1 Tax=Echinicola pacifica TaxID=346377 RepID=A0A918UKE6_9BACT|nr:hypothetical protein [Echinicola pacifica]GGZ16282.1 hypothetical protein GCM10007049_05710 [Echinicola pacifica]